MLYYAISTLYVVTCLVLLLVVLIQQGKGGDIAAAFGGGGSSQAAFGARTGATLLAKVTWVTAGLFILGALALSIIGTRGPGSVVGSGPAGAPVEQSAPAQPAPAQPAPAPAQPAEPPVQ